MPLTFRPERIVVAEPRGFSMTLATMCQLNPWLMTPKMNCFWITIKKPKDVGAMRKHNSFVRSPVVFSHFSMGRVKGGGKALRTVGPSPLSPKLEQVHADEAKANEIAEPMQVDANSAGQSEKRDDAKAHAGASPLPKKAKSSLSKNIASQVETIKNDGQGDCLYKAVAQRSHRQVRALAVAFTRANVGEYRIDIGTVRVTRMKLEFCFCWLPE